jgi:uncharacterized protein (TIGR03643 family)
MSGFTPADTSRIIEMAWEDRTTFDVIEVTYGLNESGVIALMRRELTARSFRLWRKRVSGRNTKHKSKTSANVTRQYCSEQYKVNHGR